jgi:hypothetical protein
VQPRNAVESIFFTVPKNVKLVKVVQSSKASVPISVTFAGICVILIPLSEKA